MRRSTSNYASRIRTAEHAWIRVTFQGWDAPLLTPAQPAARPCPFLAMQGRFRMQRRQPSTHSHKTAGIATVTAAGLEKSEMVSDAIYKVLEWKGVEYCDNDLFEACVANEHVGHEFQSNSPFEFILDPGMCHSGHFRQ